MASERDETKPPPGWMLDGDRYEKLNCWTATLDDAWAVYDAEHPDAALRERLGALADAWDTESSDPNTHWRFRDALYISAKRLRALLTEGQPPAKGDE